MEVSEAIAFDTHKYVKRLIESGFSERQAETLANEQVNLLNYNLATKADLVVLRAAVQADIAEAKAEIKDEIKAEIKAEIAASRAETKAEIDEVKSEVKEVKDELGEVRDELGEVRTEMARLESRLLWRLIGALFAQGALIIGLVKLL